MTAAKGGAYALFLLGLGAVDKAGNFRVAGKVRLGNGCPLLFGDLRYGAMNLGAANGLPVAVVVGVDGDCGGAVYG